MARFALVSAVNDPRAPAYLLEEPIEAGAAYAEQPRGANAVAVTHFKNVLNVHPAYFVEPQQLTIVREGFGIAH